MTNNAHFELHEVGEVIVPKNFVHSSGITDFLKSHGRMLNAIHPDITDANFPTASRVFSPGQRFTVGMLTTSEACSMAEEIEYIRRSNFVFCGVRGGILCWRKFYFRIKRLKRGYIYRLYDELYHLFKDPEKGYRVPCLDTCRQGHYNLALETYRDEVQENLYPNMDYAALCLMP